MPTTFEFSETTMNHAEHRQTIVWRTSSPPFPPNARRLMSIPRRGGVARQRHHEPHMSRGELEPCLGAGSPSPEDARVNHFARE
jgi:hypothetical protein